MSSIILYKSASDPREVSKSLSGLATYDFNPRGSFTASSGGVANIQTSTNLSGYNYAYIPDFNRYYYIDGITATRADLWSFTLRVDVLMSYASAIRTLTGTVDRQTNLRSGYLQDVNYQAQQYRKVVTKTFPNSMTNESIILMTVG